MNARPILQSKPAVADEVRRLARFQGVGSREVEPVLSALAPHLDTYAEVVITEQGLELITGGIGSVPAAQLAALAERFGAPNETARAWSECIAAHPTRMLGLKVCLGPDAAPPSLYVRTMCPTGEGLKWLAGRIATTPLADALSDNQTLYGLGFTSRHGECTIKTYTIGRLEDGTVGFNSSRVTPSGMVREHKRYWPAVPWSELPLTAWRWRRLVRFAADVLGYDVAGHFATTEREGAPDELKLYVERVGAIPTDRTAV